MARQNYQRLSPADIDEIWSRLRSGHSVKPTARALGKPTSTVRTYLLRCGGIRPDPRHRAPGRLSVENVKRSAGAWPRVCRCVRSQQVWVDRRRRSVGRSPATEATSTRSAGSGAIGSR